MLKKYFLLISRRIISSDVIKIKWTCKWNQMLLTHYCNTCYFWGIYISSSFGILCNSITKICLRFSSGNCPYTCSNCPFQCLCNYILQLICYFNVTFHMVSSNNKRKLLANNQTLAEDPLMHNISKWSDPIWKSCSKFWEILTSVWPFSESMH